MEKICDLFTFRPSDLITTLTYVLMDNFCHCFFRVGRKGRDINLITGVEHRLRTFFGITTYTGSFLDELNLVRDFVIGEFLFIL